ncbi:MAG: hypothetical protein LH610_13235 [Sphingomonas bacterium]|nr:hypothetical protein [Sphingomonas bacterium]
MTRPWLIALAIVAASAGGVALVMQREAPLAPRTAAVTQKPALAVLTSLPLLFGERFELDGGGSPTLARLEQRYRIVPVAIADAASLKGQRLLLMAHPRAQPAEVLVELDSWVRRGGRIVLLADPKLDWPSGRPLGDRLRPPPDFADTGLLAHWGLRLEGPIVDGPRTTTVGGYTVLTASPGTLTSNSPRCTVEQGGLVAQCRSGRGAATVIADADFLNVAGEGALDGPTEHNHDLLMTILSRAESR